MGQAVNTHSTRALTASGMTASVRSFRMSGSLVGAWWVGVPNLFDPVTWAEGGEPVFRQPPSRGQTRLQVPKPDDQLGDARQHKGGLATSGGDFLSAPNQAPKPRKANGAARRGSRVP